MALYNRHVHIESHNGYRVSVFALQEGDHDLESLVAQLQELIAAAPSGAKPVLRVACDYKDDLDGGGRADPRVEIRWWTDPAEENRRRPEHHAVIVDDEGWPA
jgi:hypothetical protein